MISRLYLLIGRAFTLELNRRGLDVCPLLNWKVGTPSKPGWYWVRAPHISLRVQKFYGDAYGLRTDDHYVSWLHGEPREYAGPIQEPVR